MAALLAVVSAGCGSESNKGSAPAGAGGGGGSAGFGGDAGLGGGAGGELVNFSDALADNPVDELYANPERNPGDYLGLSTDAAQGAEDYSSAALACYASADACGEAECGAFASCCVNTGAC